MDYTSTARGLYVVALNEALENNITLQFDCFTVAHEISRLDTVILSGSVYFSIRSLI
jgi:hypothetical protein